MESFFFHLDRRRYKRSSFPVEEGNSLERVDVSSGVVYFRGSFPEGGAVAPLRFRDRMGMMLLLSKGELRLRDRIGDGSHRIREGEAVLLLSTRQDLEASFAPGSEIFWLFVADFHLQRYLSGRSEEPIDQLYGMLQGDSPLELLQRQRLDALSLYLIDRISKISDDETMAGIRAEHRVNELLIHRLGLWERPRKDLDPRDRELAERARGILMGRFADPPTIPELARLCATNDFRLKKLFKKAYGLTIYDYIRRLRLEEANLLLRSEELSVGEIARRVGYLHQGHFSRIFYDAYGLYPRELSKKSSS